MNENIKLASLKENFTKNEVSMTLTSAGLMVERTEILAKLYSEHLTWENVKEIWHDKRLGGRGSRESSQKIFSIIKRRLQSGASSLPPIIKLANLLEECQSKQDKAQILFLYLIEFDVLVKYIIHELYNKYGDIPSEWDLNKSKLVKLIKKYKYSDGSSLEYSDSTIKRWVRGFRSLLYEIGFRETKYTNAANPPIINNIPLSISGYYSWCKQGDSWSRQPIGWLYLFQPSNFWPNLLKRIGKMSGWNDYNYQGKTVIKPADDIF